MAVKRAADTIKAIAGIHIMNIEVEVPTEAEPELDFDAGMKELMRLFALLPIERQHHIYHGLCIGAGNLIH